MDQAALDLIKRAARASTNYAFMAGGAFILITLISKIPVLGFVFLCVGFLVQLAAYFGIAYLVTPRLSGFPPGQSKAMVALYVGIGVAAVVTVGLLVANLIGVAFDAVFGGGTIASAAFGIVGTLIGSVIGGLIIGGVLAFLGSFVALDRNKSVEAARPF